MSDQHDYVALEWVRGEIAETLRQARQALDAVDASSLAGQDLAECLECIHQVHGSLQMVEFYGAALLAEEMEALARALQQGKVSDLDEALALLHQALAQLPLYLDRVHSARRDLPLVVLPLLNDLRSARGESLLSQTSLFRPALLDLPALDAARLARLTPAELPVLLRKWRQMLQTALVGLLREQDDASNLGYMAKVFARLETLCQDAPLGQLWQVASALVEGMLAGVIGNSPALRSLLKESDKELKRLLEQGMPGVNQPAPEELLKSLLFYIAEARQPTAQMLLIRQRYDLDEALPDTALVDEERARLAAPDRDAMRSVVAALCEELVRVKESLDLFVRSDRQHADDLVSLLAPLRQIADTLAVLGFGQPRKVIIDQLTVVQGLAQGLREPNDSVLMDVAGALLYVEATLAGMVGSTEPESREEGRLPTTDLTQIHQLVIKESRLCLHQAKDLIIDYIEADWDRERLQSLPGLLTQVRGALAMIPLNRAASLLESCNHYVCDHLLLEPAPPSWQQLDRLADALSSIEYYLERLGEDHEAPGEQVLDMAEQSLAALGYAPVDLDVPLLEEVLSPSEALVMLDLQELEDPQVAQSLADVLATPLSSVNPPARHRPGSLLPPPADEAPVDDELREVFLEETAEVLQTLADALPRWRSHVADTEALSELRRAFHTLKGSGRMVRALVLGELAWAVENLLNRVLERSVLPSPEVLQLLDDSVLLLPGLIRQFADNAQCQRDDVDQLAAQAHRLATGTVAVAEASADGSLFDPQLLEIFRNEALSHLDSLNHFLEQAAEYMPLPASDELLRALHTLKGSASMAGVLPMVELAAPLDQLVREFKAHRLDLDLDEVELLLEAEGLFRRGLKQLDKDPLAAIDDAGELIARSEALLAERLTRLQQEPAGSQVVRRDPQLLNNFLAQGMDILLDAENLLLRWQQHPGERQELSDLLDELTTLGEGAHLADLHAMDELCEGLLDLYGAVEESSLAVSDGFFQEAQHAHEALINMLDQLAAGQEITPQPARLRALRGLLDQALAPSATGLIKTDGSRALSITDLSAATAQVEAQAEPEPVEEGPDLEDEIVIIFLEEALDILENSGAALLRWQTETPNRQDVETLLRDLHTLKGGARMVEIEPIGDLAHELEFLCEGLSDGLLAPGPQLFALMQAAHDRLAQMLDALRSQQPVRPADALITAIQAFVRQTPAAQVDPVAAPVTSAVSLKVEAPDPERVMQDSVKVSAEVLEDLVNLAGETSIFRGRIEQQVNDARVALNEMETTLARMRDQLRRLETETQSRLLSRLPADAERQGYEEFDPLEMDRHSQLQQLSRALSESASDLLDLKETLSGRNRDAQTLLQQQARVNTDLQEGLMHTRMVPFERLVPRLKRIVRQVAGELGKEVEFVVGNAEGEMDRSVLERMVAPLEHMLRNAVDHGLESPDERCALGKPKMGRISLDLSHEGGDIVFDIRDDGAGVPLDAVRRKAIKRGLLEEERPISDREVLQFILQPGFSTAEKITQISGRGVGMDVVHEEVRQLGGSMTIDSIPGQGVHFQIRLPFSVSVNRAMMVVCADEQYAIPLNTVEGLVRVLPNELEAYFQLDSPRYQYAGQSYELRYLGELLQTVPRPRMLGLSQPLPVLLVHSNEQRMALPVDDLLGTREIVVKSLGPQFAGVAGLSGATLLGDGRVVPIIDLLAYVRAAQSRSQMLRTVSEPVADFTPLRPRLIMVVDDSVTVRKVTSRLLERNGMHVITAKDGVDAMNLLNEHRPDLMLLDIEMPRMDGFEVAAQVRSHPTLKDLPIIMITSRTGQKHRDRAMALGVNDYLGKPYQESLLLQSIVRWSPAHA